MNPVIDNMTSRRSCRAFLDEMPSQALIEEICKAGTYAPTGHGKQSPIILAITNRELRDRLSRMNATIWAQKRAAAGSTTATVSDPFYGAPVVLVVLADRKSPTAVYDGCSVMGNLLNAAHSVGLSSCWIHRAKEEFDSEEGREILRSLGIEGDYEGVGHCVIGYPAKPEREAMPRKADYICWVK